MRLPPAILFSLLLVGCSQAADKASAPEYAADASASVSNVELLKPPPPGSGAAPVPASTPMLAYRYRFGIEAPPKAVRQLAARHEAACIAAGPTVCQVTGSDVQEAGKDEIRATLSLRAAPAWLKTFRQGLPGEAKSVGGRLVNSNVESEDLSRAIVDTEAALRARTTLRDRLQGLLASRPGKLGELIELERELARVQGELDATQSELAMMRTRIATSEVTTSYASAGVLAPEGALAPLAKALSEVVGIFVATLAFMVRVVAVLAPWLLLGAGLWWLLRKRLRNPLRRRPAKTPEPPAV